ncbi:MAG: archaetidylinositol phosphate synthase [Thermoprotei archaeon]
MLTRIREKVSNYIVVIAKGFALAGFKPNHLTIASLLFSFLAFISLYRYSNIGLYILFALLSGLMDSVDGALARLMGKVSKRGAFLDSTLDRISDSLLIFPLIVLGYPIELIAYLLVVSLLISYVRARGEALGLKLEGVGLIERAERLLFLVVIAGVYLINPPISHALLYILAVLSTITLLQRIVFVLERLG